MTFIELLCVILILAAVVMMTMPLFKGTFSYFTLNAFTQQLQDFILYVQERAVVENKTITLSIDTKTRQVIASSEDNQKKIDALKIPELLQVTAEKKAFSFYPDGSVENATILLIYPNQPAITLVTKGVLRGAKIKRE